MQPAHATLLLSFVTLRTVPTEAAERQFVLREQLGRRWTDELVRLPFKAAPGECHRDSLRLEGPHGPVAMQLLDAEWHEDAETFVRRARIALVVDLPPQATEIYTLRFAPQAAAEATRPTSPLRVTAGEGSVEVVNGRFGARLLAGQKGYDPPAAAEDVPGPLLAMRLPDGRWFGGSRMFGSTKLTGYTSELTAAGPVVAEVCYCYRYADGNELRLRAQLGSRDTAVYWDMDVTRDASRDGWRMILSRGLPPLTFPVQMEFYSRRPCFVQRGAKVGDWATLPLDDSSEPLITRLTPWGDWWDDYTQTVIRLNLDGCRDTLLLASRDPGTWVKPAAPGERLKRMMLYLAKQYTPPDPTRGGHRLNPPLGRANAGERRLKFSSLAGGAVIEVSGDFGTDYVLLSGELVEAVVADDVRMKGTAGCVQRRGGKDVLVLAAPGLIRCAEHEVRKP